MAEAAIDSGLETELGTPEEDEDDLDSLTSSMHRIQSESVIQHTDEEEEMELRKRDMYARLERSQSDAMLMHHNSMETEDDFPELLSAADSSHNVSECNRVYLDLSRAEPFERVEFAEIESTVSMFRTSSGRQLETIPQDEELKTVDLSHLYASQRSLTNGGSSNSSLEDLSFGHKVKSSSSSKSSQDSIKAKSNYKTSLQTYSHSLKQKVRTLQMGSIPEQVNALEELNVLMEQAWSTPVYGRDLAYTLCDILRVEKGLDTVVSNLNSNHRELLTASFRLLDQCLTTPNRNYVAQCGLEVVVKVTCEHKHDVELAPSITGILESLFKTTEQSCSRVIKHGGLGVIIHWCRCKDPVILKHCAIALSNLALYGGPESQNEMITHKAPEWLFPLAFVDDDATRYYACLAMAVLASNKEIESSVVSSGTLDLVLPFLSTHDAQDFAHKDPSHVQGRSTDWLKRLVPVLSSKREEARALAAFHMVMEAAIKAEQDKKEVLYEIGAVDALKWLASTPKSSATRLAVQALSILGEDVPHNLSQQVPVWTVDNVIQWVTQVGFEDYAGGFRACQVDGDLLLRLTENELMDSIDMACAITRKRFLRELIDLKMTANYTSCDPSRLADWLEGVGSEFVQYTYSMLQAGADRGALSSLTDQLLFSDCAINNGIHRLKILNKIEELRETESRPGSARSYSCDCVSAHGSKKDRKPIDVFISYRRSNGSQLASLLKVHLQLRGFSVFIDVERLRAGKFDENLLYSVRQAKHLVLVLTPNALDRCLGDVDKQDWVHKEIAEAIECGLNIVPLMEQSFHWPPANSLPEDISKLPFFNGVRWIHDYQDACVDKLESFLRGQNCDGHTNQRQQQQQQQQPPSRNPRSPPTQGPTSSSSSSSSLSSSLLSPSSGTGLTPGSSSSNSSSSTGGGSRGGDAPCSGQSSKAPSSSSYSSPSADSGGRRLPSVGSSSSTSSSAAVKRSSSVDCETEAS